MKIISICEINKSPKQNETGKFIHKASVCDDWKTSFSFWQKRKIGYPFSVRRYGFPQNPCHLITLVVSHKHKIAHWKCVLFTYICCRKALRQLQYHFMSSSFFAKKLDMPMVLQLCGCLSATNICVNTTRFQAFY